MKKKPSPKLAHKKPAAKETPPTATATPAEADKPAEGNPARAGALPAPLSRCVDMAQLLEDITSLEDCFANNPEAPDEKWIEWVQAVMTRCQDMLTRKALSLGCRTAIGAIHAQTCYGCEALDYLANDEGSSEALKAVAANRDVWPQLRTLNPPHKKAHKDTSRDPAKAQLESIGLRTSTDSSFRTLALGLRHKIEACIGLLTRTPSTSAARKTQEVDLPEAKRWEEKFPALRDLPPFSRETCADWWPVARAMLKDYWSKHPDEREVSFRKVMAAAESEAKVEATATEYVRYSFFRL